MNKSSCVSVARHFLVVVALFTLFASTAFSATYCQGTYVQDVICYSDGSCYVTVDGYGGSRYYYIAAGNVNKNQMVSIALSMFASGGKVRMSFVPNGLNCSNVPQNTEIDGVGATKIQ